MFRLKENMLDRMRLAYTKLRMNKAKIIADNAKKMKLLKRFMEGCARDDSMRRRMALMILRRFSAEDKALKESIDYKKKKAIMRLMSGSSGSMYLAYQKLKNYGLDDTSGLEK